MERSEAKLFVNHSQEISYHLNDLTCCFISECPLCSCKCVGYCSGIFLTFWKFHLCLVVPVSQYKSNNKDITATLETLVTRKGAAGM